MARASTDGGGSLLRLAPVSPHPGLPYLATSRGARCVAPLNLHEVWFLALVTVVANLITACVSCITACVRRKPATDATGAGPPVSSSSLVFP